MFTTEEIENLCLLLRSPLADNVKIAFAILEGNPIPSVVNTLLENYKSLYKAYYNKKEINLEAICLRINQEEKLYTLDIDNNPLSKEVQSIISEHIELFRNLKVLDFRILKDNMDFVGELRDLQKVKILNRDMKTLPTNLVDLENLMKLDVSFCYDLAELPANIGNLTQLTYLNLSINKIKSIPASIGKLQKLTYLSIGSNRLFELPDELGQLLNLEYLYLNDNQLKELPHSLTQCKKLKFLTLGNNLFSREEKERIKQQFSFVKQLYL